MLPQPTARLCVQFTIRGTDISMTSLASWCQQYGLLSPPTQRYESGALLFVFGKEEFFFSESGAQLWRAGLVGDGESRGRDDLDLNHLNAFNCSDLTVCSRNNIWSFISIETIIYLDRSRCKKWFSPQYHHSIRDISWSLFFLWLHFHCMLKGGSLGVKHSRKCLNPKRTYTAQTGYSHS